MSELNSAPTCCIGFGAFRSYPSRFFLRCR